LFFGLDLICLGVEAESIIIFLMVEMCF
jgi:hypothetical protein